MHVPQNRSVDIWLQLSSSSPPQRYRAPKLQLQQTIRRRVRIWIREVGVRYERRKVQSCILRLHRSPRLEIGRQITHRLSNSTKPTFDFPAIVFLRLTVKNPTPKADTSWRGLVIGMSWYRKNELLLCGLVIVAVALFLVAMALTAGLS